MKADDGGFALLDNLCEVTAEGRTPGTGGDMRRVKTKLPVVGCQCLMPGSQCCGRGLLSGRRLVRKEVDVERLVGQLAQAVDFVEQALWRVHRCREGAKPAGIADGCSQLVALRARHGRLNNRGSEVEGLRNHRHQRSVLEVASCMKLFQTSRDMVCASSVGVF